MLIRVIAEAYYEIEYAHHRAPGREAFDPVRSIAAQSIEHYHAS